MDEALVLCAVDVSGRGQVPRGPAHSHRSASGASTPSSSRSSSWRLRRNAGITLHARLIAGENSHHIVEAAFKALARALMMATRLDPRVAGVPSTKGSL